MKRLLRYVCILATAAALSTSGAGCSKDKGPPAAEAITAESAVTEKNGDLEVTWNVTPDGQVTALVKDKDGLPVRKGVTATVTVKPQGGGAPVAVPLTPQGDAGLLTGQIPKLDADLTEVSYDVQADAARSQGTMHLPRGGTRELVESAREAAAAKPIAKDQKGPNGGVLQVVGDDIVEVVADKGSGAVRVYFLDDDLKVIPIGKRKGKLGFVGASTVVVDVTPDPGGLYLVGKVDVSIQPVKITVVVIDGDEVDVALCGYVPGGVIVVGPAAPVIGVFIVTSWPVVVVPGAVVVQPGVIVQPGVVVVKGKGKGKWKWKGKKW